MSLPSTYRSDKFLSNLTSGAKMSSPAAVVNASSLSMLLERKIKQVTAGLLPSYCRRLNNIAAINAANAAVICDYITAMKSEVNPSDYYRRDITDILTSLARMINDRSFKDLT